MSIDTGTFTSNTTAALPNTKPNNQKRPGAFSTLFASGTWGSGTLKVQVQDAVSGVWHDLTDINLTDDGAINFQSNGSAFRLDFSGGSSQDVDWSVQ